MTAIARHYLRAAWTSLMRSRAYSLINLAGLALGLAASLILAAFALLTGSAQAVLPGRLGAPGRYRRRSRAESRAAAERMWRGRVRYARCDVAMLYRGRAHAGETRNPLPSPTAMS